MKNEINVFDFSHLKFMSKWHRNEEKMENNTNINGVFSGRQPSQSQQNQKEAQLYGGQMQPPQEGAVQQSYKDPIQYPYGKPIQQQLLHETVVSQSPYGGTIQQPSSHEVSISQPPLREMPIPQQPYGDTMQQSFCGNLVQEVNVSKLGLVKKFFGGIVFSLVILGAFIGLQMVLSMLVMFCIGAVYALQMGADMDQMALVERLQEIMFSGKFMTGLTAGLTAISAIVSVLCYWLIWGRKRTPQDKKYFKEKVWKAKPIIMISISAFGLYYLALLLTVVIEWISPSTMESYSEMVEMALGGSEILAMLAAVILAPINEECIMRGLILKNLQKYFSVPAVIVIQAILFGIFHMNLVQFIYVIPVGAALGIVAVKSRSVLPCIYMHLFYNLMSFVVGLLPEFCHTVLFCVLAIVMSAIAVCIMYQTNKQKAIS